MCAWIYCSHALCWALINGGKKQKRERITRIFVGFSSVEWKETLIKTEGHKRFRNLELKKICMFMYVDNLNWFMQTPLKLKMVRIVRRNKVWNQGDDLFLSNDNYWLFHSHFVNCQQCHYCYTLHGCPVKSFDPPLLVPSAFLIWTTQLIFAFSPFCFSWREFCFPTLHWRLLHPRYLTTEWSATLAFSEVRGGLGSARGEGG